MAIIPNNTRTTEYQIESKKIKIEKPRNYLGMSSLGGECLRAQWYSWRWTTFSELSARIKRLFNFGHRTESVIVTDLKSVGIEVFRRNGNGDKIEMTGEVGEKQETIVGFQRHCKGHPDGRLLGVIEAPKTEHLAEFKTMNDKYFTMLVEAIVEHRNPILKAFPTYYAQMQRYMAGLKLTRALFVAENKNTSARKYLRVKYDKKVAEKLIQREEDIILSELPPPKRWKADNYFCNYCNHYQVCHMNAVPNRSCRSCEFCDLLPAGKWQCSITKKNLSTKKQLKGCKKYKRLF